MKKQDQIYSILDVCKRFNVSRQTVYNWIKKGELQVMPLGKKYVRITEASIQKFLEDSKKSKLNKPE